METEYSHDWKGKIIPVTYGEGLSFIDYKDRPSHSGRASYRKDGKREAQLDINTWVGTSAIGAVHYYARIKVRSTAWNWTSDADGEKHSSGGYADKGKPKEMMGMEIKIERPVDRKDIKHFKDGNDDWETRKFMMPRIGGYTDGFWTEEEAKQAALKFFKATFAKGWVLVDPYGNDGHGEDIAEGEN
jgi:hypothetical protein